MLFIGGELQPPVDFLQQLNQTQIFSKMLSDTHNKDQSHAPIIIILVPMSSFNPPHMTKQRNYPLTRRIALSDYRRSLSAVAH